MVPAIREVSRRFRTVIVYGGSMGVYAALKYGNLLEADHAIAFSPQYTLDPEVEQEKIYNRHFRPELHAGMQIATLDVCRNATVFYDTRHRADTQRVGLIRKQAPWITEIALPNTGHSCVQVFAGTANMKALFDSTIAADTAAIRRTARALRVKSVLRYVTTATAAIPRDPDLARRISAKSPVPIPEVLAAELDFKLAVHHVKARNLAAAHEAAMSAVSLQPQKSHHHRLIGQIHFLRKDWTAALQAYDEALKADPRDILALVAKANIYNHTGDRENVVGHLSAAADIDAAHPALKTARDRIEADWRRIDA
ncbi:MULTISPECIES: tetratricopeptide repeat protein [Paracoccus]|uniref:Tetratricopeptide repeat protein n=1 Tax=Paracoccus fontiphilus TaxID=1815556 RepID=A0ABV7IBZ2_9RHOB|nr:tetratricopeptide repeat protein [Paracoccus fontiphilus]